MNRRKPRKTKPRCPECGSVKVLPIGYDLSNAAAQRAARRGELILADREEWEGLPQWHCRGCGCEWRGGWRRFKWRAL